MKIVAWLGVVSLAAVPTDVAADQTAPPVVAECETVTFPAESADAKPPTHRKASFVRKPLSPPSKAQARHGHRRSHSVRMAGRSVHPARAFVRAKAKSRKRAHGRKIVARPSRSATASPKPPSPKAKGRSFSFCRVPSNDQPPPSPAQTVAKWPLVEPLSIRPPVAPPSNEFSIFRPRSKSLRLPVGKPQDLGFVSYSVTGSAGGGVQSVYGTFNAGLRLGLDAFDAGGSVGLVGGDSALRQLTTLTYRRDWFDRRLFLTIGRTRVQTAGLLPSTQVDGVRLSRQNIDDEGRPVIADRPLFRTSADRAGVLAYRVGSKVLRQAPVGPGQPPIDADFLSGLPLNGVFEVTYSDGRTTTFEPQSLQLTSYLLFAPGTGDFDLSAGHVPKLFGGDTFGVSLGGRYGVNANLTASAGLVAAPDVVTGGSGIAWRLPSKLGFLSVETAVQKPLQGAIDSYGDAIRGTARANYQFSGDHFGLAVSALANLNGGVRSSFSIKNASFRLFEFVTAKERIEARLNARIPNRPINFGLNASYETLTDRSRTYTVGAQTGGGFGRGISWNLYAETAFRSGERRSANFGLNFSKSLGTGYSGSVGYQQAGGRSLAVASVSGSQSDRFSQDTRFDVRADSDGVVSGGLTRDLRVATVDFRATRDPRSGLLGYVSSRGAFVAGGGRSAWTRDVGDTYVMLRADDLPKADVYRDAGEVPYTRLNSRGAAALSNFRYYLENNLRVSSSSAALGIEAPENVLHERIEPHRGYVVPVNIKRQRPIRIVMKLPKGAVDSSSYAVVEDRLVPVERDRSVYIENRDKLGDKLEVRWTQGETEERCFVSLDAVRPRFADAPINAIVDSGECR